MILCTKERQVVWEGKNKTICFVLEHHVQNIYYIHMTQQLLMNLYIEYIQIPENMRHVFVARNSSNQTTTEEEAPNFTNV